MRLEFLAIEKSTPERALRMYGPIAQLVEQLAFNQWVAGSSPARLITRTIAQRTEHKLIVVTQQVIATAGLRVLSHGPAAILVSCARLASSGWLVVSPRRRV